MKHIFDSIKALFPPELQTRFGWVPLPLATLNERIERGTLVAVTAASLGMAVMRAEADALDKLMLEQIAGFDPLNPVESWDEYLELRGRLHGFRLKNNLAREIMCAARDAEFELNKRNERKQPV